MKKATFYIPAGTSAYKRGPVAWPVCKTARYFCILAGAEALTWRELFILRRIGFTIIMA